MSNLYLQNEQLLSCERLRDLGFPQVFEAGSHIGRGFADLGYEQFVLLPNQQIMSLFTGHKNNFPEEQRNFFFLIPDINDLVNYLEENGWECEMLECDDGVTWTATVNSEYSSISITAITIWDALIAVTQQAIQLMNEDELAANGS
jgi:hypothetical protein